MTKPLQKNVLYRCLDICNKLCYRHLALFAYVPLNAAEYFENTPELAKWPEFSVQKVEMLHIFPSINCQIHAFVICFLVKPILQFELLTSLESCSYSDQQGAVEPYVMSRTRDYLKKTKKNKALLAPPSKSNSHKTFSFIQ